MRVSGYFVVLAGAALLAACGGEEAGAPAAAVAAPAPTDAEKQALLAALPAPYDTADLESGRRKFALCRSCHTLAEGGPNRTGPNLHGVFGRGIGEQEGYRYSDAVKAADFTWDAETLDHWLANPREFLPGNKMAFRGVTDAKERTDLIGYLMVETGYRPAAG